MTTWGVHGFRGIRRLSVGNSLKQQSIRHSHIGARPIPVPRDVTCTWYKTPEASTKETLLRIRGPKGTTDVVIPDGISPTFQPNGIQAAHPGMKAANSGNSSSAPPATPNPKILVMQCHNPDVASQRSSWGLTAALVSNGVLGVSEGFSLDLRLVGVGYRASIEQAESGSTVQNSADHEQVLVLRLGYPRPMRVAIPSSMRCEVTAPTEIKLLGSDKAALAQLAAKIRAFRPPEPYNGKGIFVGAETVQRKEVKKK